MNAGKGSKPRPVNKQIYNKNFDEINWGNKKPKNTFDKPVENILTSTHIHDR